MKSIVGGWGGVLRIFSLKIYVVLSLVPTNQGSGGAIHLVVKPLHDPEQIQKARHFIFLHDQISIKKQNWGKKGRVLILADFFLKLVKTI